MFVISLGACVKRASACDQSECVRAVLTHQAVSLNRQWPQVSRRQPKTDPIHLKAAEPILYLQAEVGNRMPVCLLAFCILPSIFLTANKPLPCGDVLLC